MYKEAELNSVDEVSMVSASCFARTIHYDINVICAKWQGSKLTFLATCKLLRVVLI